jgi:hypothetical protein
MHLSGVDSHGHGKTPVKKGSIAQRITSIGPHRSNCTATYRYPSHQEHEAPLCNEAALLPIQSLNYESRCLTVGARITRAAKVREVIETIAEYPP